jgi:hypothetical protein
VTAGLPLWSRASWPFSQNLSASYDAAGAEQAARTRKLRALLANGDFDAYWAYHLQRERQRNYPQPSASDQLAA